MQTSPLRTYCCPMTNWSSSTSRHEPGCALCYLPERERPAHVHEDGIAPETWIVGVLLSIPLWALIAFGFAFLLRAR